MQFAAPRSFIPLDGIVHPRSGREPDRPYRLGLPDEYDCGYESEGAGTWSVMAGGSWNYYPKLPAPYYYRFLGNSPPHPSAWGM